jgi:Ring finger domain
MSLFESSINNTLSVESELSCKDSICNICFEPLGRTNRTTTPCGHEFCFKCIIQAYQHNPICPSCRAPFNEATAVEATDNEVSETDDQYSAVTIDSDGNEIPWRRGRFDNEYPDCYCYPAIVETVEDFDWIMRTISGGYNAHDRIRTMIKLVDPTCKFGEGPDNNWEDECADNESETVKVVLDIYKRTQLIKQFAKKHIGKQSIILYEGYDTEFATCYLDDLDYNSSFEDEM